MQWLNEPTKHKISNEKIQFTTKHATDFWRKTRHDFIADNGHFYYDSVSGDFTAVVKVTGAYNTLYDQAGIMLRKDELTWIKCGIEFVEGVQYASAVITREASDWSIVPLEGSPASIWFKLMRIGTAVEVYFSLDGEDYTMIRQGFLTDTGTLQIGLMACSPKGQGFEAIFEDYNVTDGASS